MGQRDTDIRHDVSHAVARHRRGEHLQELHEKGKGLLADVHASVGDGAERNVEQLHKLRRTDGGREVVNGRVEGGEGGGARGLAVVGRTLQILLQAAVRAVLLPPSAAGLRGGALRCRVVCLGGEELVGVTLLVDHIGGDDLIAGLQNAEGAGVDLGAGGSRGGELLAADLLLLLLKSVVALRLLILGADHFFLYSVVCFYVFFFFSFSLSFLANCCGLRERLCERVHSLKNAEQTGGAKKRKTPRVKETGINNQ